MTETTKMPASRTALLTSIRKGLLALGAKPIQRRGVPLATLKHQWHLIQEGVAAVDARALPTSKPPVKVKIRVPLPFHLATKRVTETMIRDAERAGLGKDTLVWLRAHTRTLGDVLVEHPGAVAFLLRKGLPSADAVVLLDGLEKVTHTPSGKIWSRDQRAGLDLAGAFLGGLALSRKVALWTI